MSSDPTIAQISADLKLAAQLLSSGQPNEAVRICREILTRYPQNPQALYALGISLTHSGQPDEAIAAYQSAVLQKPNFYEAFTNLGTVLGSLNRSDEALAAFTEAARLRPDVAEIHVNLSNVYRETWKLDQAISAANRALELKPTLAEANICLGAALAAQGQFETAIDAYRQAICLRPDFPAAHLNLALALLVTGNLESAWPEYEWRQKCPGILPPKNFPQPRWTGQPLQGKSILLHPEQGLGDAIHFIRYAPMVAALGAKVLVQCPQSLVRIFQSVAGISEIHATGQPLPPFDFQILLPSLPGIFKTSLDSIPAEIPYLRADIKATRTWRHRINPTPNTRQIGLIWSGNPENRNDRNRSIPLEQLVPIFDIDQIRFHSLQISTPPKSDYPIHDWSSDLTDFAETAALIANFDLIISVDTAPAHLAAAIGKPVWLLIPFPPDWRWLLNRDDSPWYPTIRLFRQPRPGDWKTAIASIAQALSESKFI